MFHETSRHRGHFAPSSNGCALAGRSCGEFFRVTESADNWPKGQQTRGRMKGRVCGIMSALGQKQTFAAHTPMSALPPKADMCSALAHVCFGPIADLVICKQKDRLTAVRDLFTPAAADLRPRVHAGGQAAAHARSRTARHRQQCCRRHIQACQATRRTASSRAAVPAVAWPCC
jgi:hypothetical protein